MHASRPISTTKGPYAKGATLLAAYVPKESVPALQMIFGRYNGTLNLALDEEERSARSIPHVFEFSFNHTTLQVLKFDRSATYQQIGVPNMHDTDAIMALRDELGTRPGHIMNFVNLQMKWRQLICPLCGAQRWRGFRSKPHLRKTWVHRLRGPQRQGRARRIAQHRLSSPCMEKTPRPKGTFK